MLAKRIIPCLDVNAGRVVKGINFVGLRDAGDPVEVAARYDEQGADELTFLDITASSDGRDLILPIIEAVAAQVFIPLTVGGGVRRWRTCGGCSMPAPTRSASIPRRCRTRNWWPTQPAVTARSASWLPSTPNACRQADRCAGRSIPTAGASPTGLDALEWGRRMQELGAGEILLTSMDRDGTRQGFDLELTRAFSDALDIPVIASGGVGTSNIWSTASCRAMRMRCSPPAFFTMANTPWGRPSN